MATENIMIIEGTEAVTVREETETILVQEAVAFLSEAGAPSAHAGTHRKGGVDQVSLGEDEVTIDGQNTSVGVAVTGMTTANNVQVTPLDCTGGFTPFNVLKAGGGFTIKVPLPPELQPGDGREFKFDWKVT